MGFLLRLGKFWNESPFGLVVTRVNRRGRSRREWTCVHLKQRLAAVPPGLEQLENRLTPSAYALTTLASFHDIFGGTGAGSSLPGAVIEDSSGNLFGTTTYGGSSDDGTLFELKAGSGTITALASFLGGGGNGFPLSGYQPNCVIEDSSGNLFGTDSDGVFELQAGSSTITRLTSTEASAGLLEDGSGNLFGTTVGDRGVEGGGSANGTVFELQAGSSTVTTLAFFDGTNGQGPSSLLEDSGGNLFGTTGAGGPSGNGTVFEVKAGSGSITTLAAFNGADGAAPQSVIEDSQGNLFGTASNGGAFGYGTVFEVKAGRRSITTLVDFNGPNGNGAYPSGRLVEDSSGDLFGTSDSTVFELQAGSGSITTLAPIDDLMLRGGGRPSGLIEDSAGNLFGTTLYGGAFNSGSVFELSPVRLQVTTQPASQVTNGAKFDVQVSGEDVHGNVVNFTGSVTIALANNPGNATLGGTLTENALTGVADFPDLTLNATGASYTLQATSPGLNAVTTAPFQVADRLVATTEPPTQVVTGAKFDVQISAEDANGNVDPNLTGSVTMALANNPGGSTLGGTLTVNAIHGVADFSDLTLNNPGTGDTLQATSPGQTAATTTPFNVVLPPPKISGTVFQDINGNGVQDSGEPGLAGQTVYLDLAGSGTLQTGDPTATTDANGNFQLTVQTPGTYTLREVLLGGVLLSSPASGTYQVTATGGANVTGQNFADVPTSIAVPLTLPPSTPFVKEGSANPDYVEALYRSILHRDVDAFGLQVWTNALNSGALSRLQVVQGIRNSPEHFQDEVTDFYMTILSRAPDAAGLQAWVQTLESGVPEEQVATAFLNSQEYLSNGDKYFVDHMYLALLGRPFDPPGEANWLSALGDDASGNPTHPPSLTHAQVITDFLYSNESLNRLVQGYYQVFLDRLADPTGLSAWLAALQQGGSFLAIGQQFLSSNEFYNNAAAEG
jgi:uncharacterized repeat protein (TIGR03803 family)